MNNEDSINSKQLLKPIFSLLFLILYFLGNAQSEVEMADDFRGEGKIYVVVFVLLIILSGIFVQLFRLEKKVKKMEKENQ